MNSTDTNSPGSICILPKLTGLGGPASFQSRLIDGLKVRGYKIHHNPLDVDCEVILVNGGTRRVSDVLVAKQRGVRVIQRLAQTNWVYKARWTGIKHHLRSEINNRLLAFIRRGIASRVIYQSRFVEDNWNKTYGTTPASGHVIYNGVDLQSHSPQGESALPEDHVRLLVVEGHMGRGHEQELENAVLLAEQLAKKISRKVELMVVGDVPEKLKQYWEKNADQWITWQGIVGREQIPWFDRSAHLLFSSELNAGCPNSVIEAMACGLPVIGFETGSLPELLSEDAGLTVPYNGNLWKLEKPEYGPLADAAVKILDNQEQYRAGARKRAEDDFNIEETIRQYLQVLLD